MALSPTEYQQWQRKVGLAKTTMIMTEEAAQAVTGMSRDEARNILGLENQRKARNRSMRLNKMLTRREM
jgi:hypothetical protein